MKKSALPIATPCGEKWEAMTPDGGGRLCASCDKVVHDLSSMSEARAARLLASKGNLCVRYLFDERGNVWFAGEKPPLAARLLNRAKRGAAVALAIGAPLSLQACMGLAPEVPYDTTDAGHVGNDPTIDDDAGAGYAPDHDASAEDAETDAASPTPDGGADDDGGDAGL